MFCADPWLVVALATAVMVAMTAGARFIAVTNDYRLMFGADNPELAAFDALENTFSESNRAVIAIAPGEGSVFTRETLGAIEELTEAAWRAPYSSRVDSLTNYSHSEAFEDDLTVAPLVEDAQSLSDADLARIEAIALNSIETAGRLVSVDGRVGGLVINFFLPDELDVAVVEITDYLNAVLDEARASNADIGYYLTGDVVMNRAFADATQDDLRRLMPIVFMVIVAVAAILLRSVLGTLAIVAVVIVRHQHHHGVGGLARHGVQPHQSRGTDHRHGGDRGVHRSHRGDGAAASEPGSGQESGHCGIPSPQSQPGLSDHADDCNRIPEA